MNLQTEERPGCQVELKFTFEKDEVDAAFKVIYDNLNTRGKVPGFRPGKAPKAILIRRFGWDDIRNGAWADLVLEPMQDAVKDLELVVDPDFPTAEECGMEEGQPLEMVVVATVRPRVELGDVEGIPLVRPADEATEEEIAEVLADLQETHAEETKPDRDVVTPGDVVDVELTITFEDETEPIEEIEETLVVGTGDYVPPIDGKLPGHLTGQTVEMAVTYPEDYHDDELAGKSASVAAKIVEIRERKLPELDDEFARKLDEEKFSTFDDLRAEVKRQLDKERAAFSRDEMESQIANALVERCEVDVPEVLIEDIAERETDALSGRLEGSGLDLEGFQEVTGMSEEKFQERQFKNARRVLMVHAIFDEIAKQREFDDPSAEELATETEDFAEEQGIDLSFVKQAAAIQPEFSGRMKERIKRRKVLDSIIGSADLQDMAAEEYRSKRDEILKIEDEEPEAGGGEEGAAQEGDEESSGEAVEPLTEAPAEPEDDEAEAGGAEDVVAQEGEEEQAE